MFIAFVYFRRVDVLIVRRCLTLAIRYDEIVVRTILVDDGRVGLFYKILLAKFQQKLILLIRLDLYIPHAVSILIYHSSLPFRWL